MASAPIGGAGTNEDAFMREVEGYRRVNEFFDAMSGTRNIIDRAMRGQKVIVNKDGTKLIAKRVIRIKRTPTSRNVGRDYYSPPKFTIVYMSDTGNEQEIERDDMVDIYPLPAKGGAHRRTRARRTRRRRTTRRHH